MFVGEITEGWDGDEVLIRANHKSEDDAMQWMKRTAPKFTRWYSDFWTCTTGHGRIVVDFGSHQRFGRVYEKQPSGRVAQ